MVPARTNPARRARRGLAALAAAALLVLTVPGLATAQGEDPPEYAGFSIEPESLNLARVVAGEIDEIVMTLTVEGDGEIDTPEVQLQFDVYDPRYLGEMELVEESSNPTVRTYEYRYRLSVTENGTVVDDEGAGFLEDRWEVQLKAGGVVRRDIGYVPMDDFSAVGYIQIYGTGLATPKDVTFNPTAGTYTVPAVKGVTYLIGTRPVAPGTYRASGPVTVSAEPARWYEFTAGATTRWSHDFPRTGTPTFHLNNGWDGTPEHVFPYGRAADEVLIGDWDGDGRDTITVRRGSKFYVSNSPQAGDADAAFTYGRQGDVILVGDWNGDGTDTLAVRRGRTYFVKNSLGGGSADRTFLYGRPDDIVMVGDWNGNGADTFAVRRGSDYFVKNSMTGGAADVQFTYGRERDVTLAGDWDGNGTDTFSVRRGQVYHVKNSLRGGEADFAQAYGRADDEVYVGDWNGDGRDTLGVRRVG